MAVNLAFCDQEDEDYIDMEISSFTNFFCHSVSSPPRAREFEFQMASSFVEREPTNSPADELFYKGKLLPLHLPPRLQMVEKLLQNSNSVYEDRKDNFNEFYSTPSLTTTFTTPTATSTPFESCNISPYESCQVSRELNPGEYFEYPSEVRGFMGNNSKRSWSRKLKHIKQSSFGSKLKASRAYLKALFGKSGYSDESCKAAAKVADEDSISQAKGHMHIYKEAAKINPSREVQKEIYQIPTVSKRSFDSEKITERNARQHRRTFSLAIRQQPTKWFSPSSSSSDSSFSGKNSSTGFHDRPYLKRSNSVNSEIENSIQGAIAHCKQSQMQMLSEKAVSEAGFYTLTTSKVSISEEPERLHHCKS